MASNTLKGITIEIVGDTTELTAALKKVDSATSEVGKALSEVEKGLKFNPDNVTLLGQKQEYAARQAENLKERVEVMTRALSQVSEGSEAFNKLQRDIVTARDKMSKMEAKADEARTAIERINAGNLETLADAASHATQGVEELSSGLAQVASGAAMAVGSDLVSAASSLVTAAGETGVAWDAADARIAAATGSATGYAEQMSSTLRELYADGWGDSIEGLTETAVKAREVLGELNEQDLSTVITSVETMESVFGSDVTESLRGVNVLMEKFGLSATEACDLMMSGMQRGLDYTDELGDNLSEYAGRWAETGMSATEYFSLLQAGVDAGAYSLDKVGDYLNEFLTSLSDGRMESSIGNFSAETQAVWESYQSGGATAQDVLNAVVGELRDCESQTEALALASDTWSSLGEDNALGVITALADVEDSYTDTAGAAQEAAEAVEGSMSQSLEAFGRSMSTALEPFASAILELATSGVEALEPLVRGFASLGSGAQAALVGGTALTAALTKAVNAMGGAGAVLDAVKAKWAALRVKLDESKASHTALTSTAKATAAAVKAEGAAAETAAGKVGLMKTATTALAGLAVSAAAAVVATAIGEVAEQMGQAAEDAENLETVTGGLSAALASVDGSSVEGLSTASSAASQSVSELRDEVSQLLADTAELYQSLASSNYSTEFDASRAESLASTIEELAAKESLTEEEQRKLTTAVEEFNDLTGASVEVVDASTGTLNTNAEAIDKVTEAYKNQLRTQAYKDALTDLYSQQAEALMKLNDAKEASAEASEELAAAQENLKSAESDPYIMSAPDLYGQYQQALATASAAAKDASTAQEEAQAAYDSVSESIGTYEDALGGQLELQAETADTTEQAADAADSLADATDGASQASEGLADASEASLEGLRGCCDTAEELAGFLDALEDGSKSAGEAVEEAFRGAMGDGKSLTEVTEEVNSALKEAGVITDDLTEREVAAGYAAGMTGDEFVAYATQVQQAKDAQEEATQAAEEAKKAYDELCEGLSGLAGSDTGVARWLSDSGYTVESFAAQLQSAGKSFSDFESDYSSMVETLRNGNDLIRDSWENVPSAEEYAANLYQNNVDYLTWQSSLSSLTDYVSGWADDSAREMGTQFISALAEMGPEYEPLVEDFLANPEAFGNAAWEWSQSGKHVMESAADGMAEGTSEVEQAATDVAEQATDSLASGVEAGAEKTADSASVLGESTMNALMDLPSEMQARGEAAGGYLGIGLGSATAQAYMASGAASLAAAAQDVLIDLSSEMQARGEYAGGMFAEGMASSTASAESLSTSVAESLADFADDMRTVAEAGGESFAQGLLAGEDASSSNGRALADAACEGAEPGKSGMSALGKATGQAYGRAVSSGTSLAASSARALLQACYGAVADGMSGMSARGQAAGGSYGQGILYGYTTAYSNAKALAQGAVEAMRGYESSAFAAGQSLGSYFASGLSSATSAAISSARSRVSSTVLSLSNLGKT